MGWFSKIMGRGSNMNKYFKGVQPFCVIFSFLLTSFWKNFIPLYLNTHLFVPMHWPVLRRAVKKALQ